MELDNSGLSGSLAYRGRLALGGTRPDLGRPGAANKVDQRTDFWTSGVHHINWELFDRGVEAYTWYTLEELAKAGSDSGLSAAAPHGEQTAGFATAADAVANSSITVDAARFPPFGASGNRSNSRSPAAWSSGRDTAPRAT